MARESLFYLLIMSHNKGAKILLPLFFNVKEMLFFFHIGLINDWVLFLILRKSLNNTSMASDRLAFK